MRFRGIKKAEVFIVDVCEGDGTKENPCRVVHYYLTQNEQGGYEMLCKKDIWGDEDE